MMLQKYANRISILRNTSTSGSIAFAAKADFTTAGRPISIAIGDLDGDGKPDLSMSNETSNNISVIRNTSTSGPSGYGTRAMASIKPHSTVRRRILVRPLHAHARLACSGIMRCR